MSRAEVKKGLQREASAALHDAAHRPTVRAGFATASALPFCLGRSELQHEVMWAKIIETENKGGEKMHLEL